MRYTYGRMRIIKTLYNSTHWFTDKEAWGIYRFAAYVEAGIWGFFIATAIYFSLSLPLGYEVFKYGRSLFGTAYGVYVILVLVSARSMEWRAGKVLAALFAGIPPFGSLVFVYIVRKQRMKHPPRVAPPKHLEQE